MRRLSFFLCLALLVSQLGLPVGAMAAAWTTGSTGSSQGIALESSAPALTECHAQDAAACSSLLQCDGCELCHACHAPGLLNAAPVALTAAAPQSLSSNAAAGHLGADSPPDIKPPIL